MRSSFALSSNITHTTTALGHSEERSDEESLLSRKCSGKQDSSLPLVTQNDTRNGTQL